MKKKLYIGIVCIYIAMFSQPIMAQDTEGYYFPNGTTWDEQFVWQYQDNEKAIYGTFQHTVTGNETIDGKTYKHVEAKLIDFENKTDQPTSFESFDYAIREDGAKIYLYNSSNKEEKLIYDFDWHIGDIVWLYDGDDNGASIEIEEIKQMKLADGNTYDYLEDWQGDMAIIKGIGKLQYGIFDTGKNFRAIYQQTAYTLSSFTRNGQLIYQAELPTTIQSTKHHNIRGQYTLDGRRTNKPQRGVSIVKMEDGTAKKVLVK